MLGLSSEAASEYMTLKSISDLYDGNRNRLVVTDYYLVILQVGDLTKTWEVWFLRRTNATKWEKVDFPLLISKFQSLTFWFSTLWGFNSYYDSLNVILPWVSLKLAKTQLRDLYNIWLALIS